MRDKGKVKKRQREGVGDGGEGRKNTGRKGEWGTDARD